MNRTGTFDWYQLSKINQDEIDIAQFSLMIKNKHFGPQLNKVPNSLRQKLLIVFQNSSNIIKNKYQQQNRDKQQFKFSRKVLNQQISVMKADLQNSIAKINYEKSLIEQNKRVIQKIRQKIKKKKQKKDEKKIGEKKQIYFCPFCTKQDFSSRNQFIFHMHKQHSQNPSSQKDVGSYPKLITEEFKQFMLSLKDKQIEMVEMMLNKKKQIQKVQLENIFSKQIRKIKTQTSFQQRKSINSRNRAQNRLGSDNQQFYESDQQLKGESQYLFYPPEKRIAQNQKSNGELGGNIRHVNDSQVQTVSKLKSNLTQNSDNKGVISYNNQKYQVQYSQHQNKYLNRPQIIQHKPKQAARIITGNQRDYYNIFSQDVALSQVENSMQNSKTPSEASIIKQIRTPIIENNLQKNSSEPVVPPNTNNLSNQIVNRNLSWQSNVKQKIQPLKPLQGQVQPIQSKIYVYNQTQKVNSQKLVNKPQVGSPQKRYETVYIPSKSRVSVINDGFIFSSGPLIDDSKDSQSDYQDYFKIKQDQTSKDQVQDEQIKVIKPKYSAKPNQNQKQMDYKLDSRNNLNYQSPVLNYSKASCQGSKYINQSNVALQYSKDKSLIDVSHSKEKSSDLIDLSNSFSKRALQSSKNNDQTINLSDLKFSKLQKMKLAENLQRYKLQMQQQKLNPIQSYQKVINSFSRPTYANQENQRGGQSILQQFKRNSEIQIRSSKYTISKTQKPKMIQKVTAQMVNKLKMPENFDLLKTNPGILEQFLHKTSQN